MGKVIGTVGVIVGAVALAATGIGAIAAPGLAGAISIGGIKASTLLLAGTALQTAGRALTKQPKASTSTTDRLNASMVTDTPRKMAFGRTALNTDLRYQEWWGREQEYCSQVFAVASHHCEAIEEVWLDDKLAWTAAGGVQGEFVGYLVVAHHAQAGPGSVYRMGWSNRWGASATFSGCATLYLQFKVTGNGKKGKSPFTTTITSRVTVVGKGARVPDPRFDSTAGGSGALRVADQTTWAWAPQGHEAGRNPALALLFYLIGWRIQNPATGEWKLAVGRGVPVDRIDLGSFITAANLCDEPVMQANGQTEPRYRCDGTFSESDDPAQVIAAFETCMNAKLRDSSGRFALQVLHNDLATPVVDFTDDDVLGDFTWTAGNDLNDRRNIVRGRYTNPSALYQLADFPQVRLTPVDGIDRIDSVDFALVQSGSQGQRLAKQRLQRQQYQGAFGAEFNARGWAVKDGDIVRLTFSALGFDKKLFRVSEGMIDPSGVVPLVLVEEHQSIYAWDREEAPAVQAAVPNTFDPLLLPIIVAIDEAGTTAEWPAITGEGKPDDHATNSADPDSPFGPDGTVKEAIATLERIDPIEVKTELLDLIQADQAAAIRQAARDNATLARALLRATDELNRTREVFRDAGVTVNPTTGEVRIYAVDQVADRTSQAEIRLNAVQSSLNLRVTLDQLNEAILRAQLDPSGQVDVDAIFSRLTNVEIGLDGVRATLLLKADATTVTALGGVVTSVSQSLDALAGVVETKASSTAVSGLTERVGSVEQTIRTLGDVSSMSVELRQARIAVGKAGQALLAGVVANEEANARQVLALSQARQELQTFTTEGLKAEAFARTLLTARVGGTEASLATEIRVRAEQNAALTQSITEQGVRIGNLNALVVAVQKAQADDKAATATTIEQVRASVTAADKARQDGDAAANQARADGDAANLAVIRQIDARVTQVAEASVTEDQALSRLIQQVSARINGIGDVGLEQSFQAIVTRLGQIEGQYTFAIDTNGHVVGWRAIGAESGLGKLALINMDLYMGDGRHVFDNGQVMEVRGLGFGKNRDLLSWFGPSMPIEECTRANGIEWRGTEGLIFTSAAIKAGPFTNSGTSTLIAADASFSLGPFTSNGKSKTVVASYTFRRRRQVAPGGGGAASGAPSATLVLEYQSGPGIWSQVGTIQTGNPVVTVAPATGEDPGFLEESMSGSITWTDTRTMLEGYVYRLRLTARQQASFTGTAQGADSITQSLSIVSQE